MSTDLCEPKSVEEQRTYKKSHLSDFKTKLDINYNLL